MENKKAIVIGAGVSGMSAAIKLKDRGFEVTVLEKAARAGGVIDTFSENGFKAESGSNSVMVQSKRTLDFLDRIAAKSKMELSAPAAKKRFFAKYGKPQAVPMSPFSLLATPLFSLAGKFRLLCEPFVKSRSPDDESVAAFTLRRFGRDVLDYAINPFMAGIYGGNPERLAVRYAFAPFWNLEKKYGSVIRGAIKSMREKKAAGNFFKPMMISFEGGMKTLADALAENLGASLRCNAKVLSIDFGGNGWQVEWVAGEEECCDNYDALVIAVPAPEVAALPFAGSLAAALAPLEKIEVVMHRESVIHGMAELCDGSVRALLSVPSMALAIESALFYPKKSVGAVGELDFVKLGTMEFAAPDFNRYPCLELAQRAAKAGEGACIALSAADEVLVEAFLAGTIGFTDIANYLKKVLHKYEKVGDVALEDIFGIDADARKYTYSIGVK